METEHHEVRSWFVDVFDHKVPQRHQRDKLKFAVLIARHDHTAPVDHCDFQLGSEVSRCSNGS